MGNDSRRVVQVKLPCGTCLHQGVCLIEEQLEEDLTLRIGSRDRHSRRVYGGPGQPVEVSIDCSWFDPRPLRPPEARRRLQLSDEERERRRQWGRELAARQARRRRAESVAS